MRWVEFGVSKTWLEVCECPLDSRVRGGVKVNVIVDFLEMDRGAPKNRHPEVDLEQGLNVGEDNSGKVASLGVKVQTKALIAKVRGVFVDETRKDEESADLPLCNGFSPENVKLGGGKNGDNAEKKVLKEKRKKASNKKAPKPPRPPRGPSLDASDQKLIKEISELVMLKRARIERMKASKKVKATKPSSNSNLFAMVFTVVFFLVMLFQGMPSRFSFTRLPGSDMSTETADGGLISVQFLGNQAPSDPKESSSILSNSIEPIAGSDPPDTLRRAVG